MIAQIDKIYARKLNRHDKEEIEISEKIIILIR